MNHERKLIWILLLAIVAVGGVVLGAYYYVSHQKEQLNVEKTEWVAQEKQSMEAELKRLEEEYMLQYEKVAGAQGEKSISFSSDNLLEQLEQEKNRVAELRRELKNVRTDNTQRIAELTSEINTLRGVLRSYVNQIDSLHATNQRLSQENVKAREEIAQINNKAVELNREKEQLSGIVQRAARLSTVGFKVSTLDKRGKSTSRIDKITNIAVSFTIPENITASTGYKVIYIRILNPNDQPLGGGASFSFEGKTLQASAQKEIEYTGEQTTLTIYKAVSETLLNGVYRVDVFADGHLIGKQTFTI